MQPGDERLFFEEAALHSGDTSGFETCAFKAAQTADGGRYGVITLHRPSNVDSAKMMTRIGGALLEIAAELPLIFPVRPRTRGNLEKFGIDLGPNITLVGPQAYVAFLNLWKDAAVVLTDSGGLREETTALGVQCITIRKNTERPVTVLADPRRPTRSPSVVENDVPVRGRNYARASRVAAAPVGDITAPGTCTCTCIPSSQFTIVLNAKP